MEDLPELSSDKDEFPEGDMFPLNSRRIKGCWIQRIAEALELPGRASLEETRQMIEGKLMELQYQPQNMGRRLGQNTTMYNKEKKIMLRTDHSQRVLSFSN